MMLNNSMDDDENERFIIEVASEKHIVFAPLISATMEESAIARGTGIAKRPPEVIANYIKQGNALIALDHDGTWAGFCYLSTYDDGAFVSNSGLIVAPAFREHGLARDLKEKLLTLCREKYPHAAVVGITTSPAVMKINTALGFYPTSFADLPRDEKFWKGCESCVNCDILKRTNRRFCLCTAMRYDRPANQTTEKVYPEGEWKDTFHRFIARSHVNHL